MLIRTGDKQCTGGPLDFICILKSDKTGRFHPAFVEEKPLPGPVASVENTSFVRVKSKMHHTAGFDTFEEAVESSGDMRSRLVLDDDNVALEHAVPWDEEQMAFVLVLPNWKTSGKKLNDILGDL